MASKFGTTNSTEGRIRRMANGKAKRNARSARQAVEEIIRPDDGRARRDAIRIRKCDPGNQVSICIMPGVFSRVKDGQRLRVKKAVNLKVKSEKPEELPQRLEAVIATSTAIAVI